MQSKYVTLTFNNSFQTSAIKQLLEFLQGKDFKAELIEKDNNTPLDITCSSETREGKHFVTVEIKNDNIILYSTAIRCGIDNFISLLLEIQSFTEGNEALEVYWKYLAIIEKTDDTGLIEEFRREWILKLQALDDPQILFQQSSMEWDPEAIFISIFSNQFVTYWGKHESFFISTMMQRISPEAASNLSKGTVKERIEILYRELFPDARNVKAPDVKKEKENVLSDFSIEYLLDIGQDLLSQSILANLYNLYKSFKPDAIELDPVDDSSGVDALLDFYILMLGEIDEFNSKIHFSPALQDLEDQAREKKSVLSLFATFIQEPTALTLMNQEHASRFLHIKKEHLGVFISLFNQGSCSLINAFFAPYVSDWIGDLKNFYEKQGSELSKHYFYEQGLLLLRSEKESDYVFACLYQTESNLIWAFFKKFSTLSQIFTPQTFNQVILPALLAIDSFSEVTWKFQTALLDYLRSPINSEDEKQYLETLINQSYAIDTEKKENSQEIVILDLNAIAKRPMSVRRMNLPNPIPNPEATWMLNTNLESLGYERRGATGEGNDCLIDVMIQLVNEELEKNGGAPINSDVIHSWAKEIKEKMGKNPNDWLSINENPEASQLVYLFQMKLAKQGIFVNFTLESYWADGEGNVTPSDNDQEISNSFSKVYADKNMSGYVVSMEVCLRILSINFNHYEPLIKKNLLSPTKRKLELDEEFSPQKKSKQISFWQPNQDVIHILKIEIRLDDNNSLLLHIPMPQSFEDLNVKVNEEFQKQLPDEKKVELGDKKLALKGKEIQSETDFKQIMNNLSEELLHFTITEEDNTQEKQDSPRL